MATEENLTGLIQSLTDMFGETWPLFEGEFTIVEQMDGEERYFLCSVEHLVNGALGFEVEKEISLDQFLKFRSQGNHPTKHRRIR